MTRRAWNAAVAWLWYAFGCPPRFPVRQLRGSLLWDVCDPITGAPVLIVPGRHAARTLAAGLNRAALIRYGYGAGRRFDYAQHGEGWIR